MTKKKGSTWSKPPPKGIELDALARGIEYWRVRRGNLPKTELAARAKVPAASIIRATRGVHSLQMSNVTAVARALGISVPALFAQIDDDVLDWVREHVDLVRAMMALLRLSGPDAAAAQRLLAGLRHDGADEAPAGPTPGRKRSER
jgi:hypothetical protein